ncbi:quinoprotein dehydrogenase-associated SoxYZ-like carrier [Hyphomicrobium sulfonivorans]|uniref:quinoprotein dehydrogenase-associated SoxYZ-like carrier n=1 Tax=Hyphomicrobium sulfonivorans TaxID=121290 RepID=UPI001570A854|nr:quinoprotein dehydrogenase-associated SoxYZ-like carrier [Hyphomicrobium sulfonivorans]MBI1650047.1 quinoprotein dehydrogenase-associated SoxYZ-like carrier [Hyphomicrobium sulfonivorans]NSL72965.1 quinoprotein dehydrogenase-associated SoxYZ-like carrier [Hyphomicrobium sulfonivorans]
MLSKIASCFTVRRIAGVVTALMLAMPVAAIASDDDDPWPDLQKSVFGDRQIVEGDGVVTIEAPERAEDPAVVPITISVPATVQGPLRSMALIIDKNPAPIAAKFEFGPAAGSGGERRMTTRVRVDTYTFIRAIVETEDGKLHMAKAFVKASGGCSAPAPKDADGANADIGKMMVRSYEPEQAQTALRDGLVMIKHPNNSGLQIDQVSRGYVPAWFIRDIEVKRGDDLIFNADLGISISTNPNLRFTYVNDPDGNNAVQVTAIDSARTTFTGASANRALAN